MEDYDMSDEHDNGHVEMGGIVIDDYDEYDQEYFAEDGEEANTFGQESRVSVEQEIKPERNFGSRLSVDAAPGVATNNQPLTQPQQQAYTEYQHSKEEVSVEEVTTEVVEEEVITTDVVEEVEEIEEEEEEEEEEGYERFNRTEVQEHRVSVLNRLGPK